MSFRLAQAKGSPMMVIACAAAAFCPGGVVEFEVFGGVGQHHEGPGAHDGDAGEDEPAPVFPEVVDAAEHDGYAHGHEGTDAG